jgi:UDP-glucuronate 4-epimerase
MTTLVTGGCGFVGLNLAEALIAKGEQVVLLDRISLTPAAQRKFNDHADQVSVVQADVRDAAGLAEVFRSHGIRRVIHTAVITAGTERESAQANDVIDVNLRGTLNVLEAAKAARCKRVVCVSSGAAYGKTLFEQGPLREETSPSRPDTVYGITKFAAEQIALRLGDLWGLDVICVRIGSVCGPWEVDTGVRDLLTAQLQVARLAVRGQEAVVPAKEVRRDWVYSRDVAAGLVAVLGAEKPKHRIYHLSSGFAWDGTFSHWCNLLREAYPKFSWHVAAHGETPNVSFLVVGDRASMAIERIIEDIGFQPRFGPCEAYADYITWMREHQAFMEA